MTPTKVTETTSSKFCWENSQQVLVGLCKTKCISVILVRALSTAKHCDLVIDESRHSGMKTIHCLL